MTDILNVHTGATSVGNQKSDVKKYMENLKPDLPDESNEQINRYGGSVKDVADELDVATHVWLIDFCHKTNILIEANTMHCPFNKLWMCNL